MKTNVRIKFSTVDEYREIESKLEELGYVNDRDWNENYLNEFDEYKDISTHYVDIDSSFIFGIYIIDSSFKAYENLQEFLND